MGDALALEQRPQGVDLPRSTGPGLKGKRVIQLLGPRGMPWSSVLTSEAHFEDRLREAGLHSMDLHRPAPVRQFARVLKHLKLLGNLVPTRKTAFFTQVHGVFEPVLFPTTYFSESIIYAWDCWPDRYPQWDSFFRRHWVRVAFLSARQNVERFQALFPSIRFIWLPEAAEQAAYRRGKPLKDRSIDVLELGRRFPQFHAKVRGPLAAAAVNGRKLKHKYAPPGGWAFAPSQDAVAAGYAESMISVCFPASMTHPEWARGVETATLRYFEAMASRCLLVGHGPAELADLWGYNPVVEADLKDPAGQLLGILANIERYQELVDRNYERFLQVGTWEQRARTVVTQLDELGYRIG